LLAEWYAINIPENLLIAESFNQSMVNPGDCVRIVVAAIGDENGPHGDLMLLMLRDEKSLSDLHGNSNR
jgi:hypothetical protein